MHRADMCGEFMSTPTKNFILERHYFLICTLENANSLAIYTTYNIELYLKRYACRRGFGWLKGFEL